ncbi:hypothetical protein KPL35_06690 [Clostridium sp. CF011]|uniref:hypothetical protein n=1 Tax=Clostridium sp. CF011 TaxID=2843318 RepID=UPI001C0E595D|nr:hypothetical protein [Clostridium sp. CF011]MBU3091762.1 hypothetical protein [Clostridium sp. CF011]WAG69469.1 hypothetical protein LL036_15955 [Clostridium sp. CF011]
MNYIKKNISKVLKQIIITQIISIIFAIAGGVYLQCDWTFKNGTILVLGIGLLTLFYIIIMTFFIKANWINILLVSVPYYLVYSPIITFEVPNFFNTQSDPNDFGARDDSVRVYKCSNGKYNWHCTPSSL